jgi:hypothetical protein
MQILFNNNPHRSHHAGRQKWFRFLTLAVWLLLLLPAKLQATVGDPIPGVDVSVGKKHPDGTGGIAAGFNGKVRFKGWLGDMIDVTATNSLYEVSTNTSFRVTAGNLPEDQFEIVEEDYTNDSLAFTGTPHVPVLPATVSVLSNRVVVANLGSSGQAGIIMEKCVCRSNLDICRWT